MQNPKELVLPSKNLRDEWLNYNRDVTSPNSYIDFSFYFMIAAALQRRVYFQGAERPIFSNQYTTLVGGPGTGKGMILRPVARFLRYHKLNQLKTGLDEFSAVTKKEDFHNLTEEEIQLIKDTQEQIGNMGTYESQKTQDEPLLFPIAPDSTTFEDLTRIMAKSIRRINVPKEKLCALVPPTGIYTHNSLILCLEELSSLFKKKSEKIIDFLTRCYDCDLYTNSTKTQGVDVIKRPCLNMIVGTQPNFLMDSYSEKLLGEGFSSRSVFVCEEKKRFEKFYIPEPDEEQLAAKFRIIAHLFNLSKLFGEIKISDEAFAFMKNHFENVQPKERINPNNKLDPYYERKKVHTVKFAMAIHFSRSYDFLLTLDDCKDALNLLNSVEPRMHLALQSPGRTVHSIAQKKIVKFLEAVFPAEKNVYEIWLELEAELDEQRLTEMLKYLTANGILEYRGGSPTGKYRRAPRNVQEIEKTKNEPK